MLSTIPSGFEAAQSHGLYCTRCHRLVTDAEEMFDEGGRPVAAILVTCHGARRPVGVDELASGVTDIAWLER